MKFLRAVFFEGTLSLAKVLSFFTFSFSATNLITLETAESAHVHSPPSPHV